MNSRAKGMRAQRKLILVLQEMGYLVSKVEQGGLYVKEKDMFSLFDLCCIREDKLLLVQVTNNTPHTHRRFAEFSLKYDLTSVYYEQWVWFARQGWKVFEYSGGKYKVIRDDRKK